MKQSKKTITILNRSITFTQNWSVRIAAIFSIVVFLVSCEEDVSELGFKSAQKFKVYYAEIPIKTSVVWMDSLRTTNLGYSTETPRILAGKYTDPSLGTVQAQAYMQYRPNSVSTFIPVTAVYDSIAIQIRCDFYSYGTSGITTQTFEVHELTEELFLDKVYNFNSNVAIDPISLGSKSIKIDQQFFKTEFDDTDKDSTITIRVKLNDDFGKRLYDAIDPEDENFTNFTKFKTTFKGLSIVAADADKLIGFNHTDLNSYMILYYHDGTTSKTLTFSLATGIAFTKVSSDWSSTDLAGLNKFFTDYDPGTTLYTQAGTSLVTKLDLAKFYEYTDTIPNLIINSAEIEIANIENSADFYIPKTLSLALLRDDNRYRSMTTKQDSLDYYGNLARVVTIDSDSRLLVSGDLGGTLAMTYNSTDKKYLGFPTMFLQRLFNLDDVRYQNVALIPTDPQQGKAVSRLVFPKDQLKLKIYYTRPNLSE